VPSWRKMFEAALERDREKELVSAG
jgi:hypothetical protein